MIAMVLQVMVEYFGQDRQRIGHALKVYGFARAIALRESLDNDRRAVLECAAALHNIGASESMRAFGSLKDAYKEIMGRKVAMELLESLGLSRSFVEDVIFLIAHHNSHGVDGGSALQMLIEADVLVKTDEGRMDGLAPLEIMERYMKTKTGREMFASMYCIKPLVTRDDLTRGIKSPWEQKRRE